MKYNLCEMVKIILSAMDSDEINSIDDTIESQQVALLIKGVYFDIATDLGLPEHETLFELTESGTSLQPTLMTVPSNVTRVDWVRYDNKADADTFKQYEEVRFMEFQEFLVRQYSLREQTADVGELIFKNNITEDFDMMYWTDRMPLFYTTMDDFTYLFDAHDVAIDTSTLQKSKTLCQGLIFPDFEIADAFTPDLNTQQFSFLVAKAKTRAFLELKQQQNPEAAAESRRQLIRSQRVARTTEDIPQLFQTVRYGRRGSTTSTNIAKRLRNAT